MKWILRFSLILFCSNAFCQTSDYEIYSEILNDYVKEFKIPKKHSKKAVILDKLNTKTNWAVEGYEYIDYALWEGDVVDSTTKRIYKQMLYELKDFYVDAPTLIIDSLHSSLKLKQMNTQEFDKLFEGNLKNGWELFYQLHPRTIGAFSFSKIIYRKNVALVFVNLNKNYLFARGDFIIMKKINNEWIIDNWFNMYKA